MDHKSPKDPNNKIKHAEKVYKCKACGMTFEYLSQAKGHRDSKGSGRPTNHDYMVIERSEA